MMMSHSSPSLIVGREQEQARLRAFVDAARDGRGSVVLLSGEAGIGKTTLIDDLAQGAAASGARVLTGHCYDLTRSPPYGPWSDMLSAQETHPATPFQQPDSVHSQQAFLEQAQQYFSELASQRLLLLVLEDIHWSDHASLDVLRFLARRVATLPIVLIVTYREEEIGRSHPLYRLLPVLVREAHAERIELGRLGEDILSEWMARRYPLSPRNEKRLVSYLHAHAEGNPLFITEMLRTLESERVRRPTLAGWTLRDAEHVGVPVLLKQIIDARLDGCSSDVRELLTLAAVIGHDIPLAIWGTVAGIDERQLLEAIDAASSANLLHTSPDGLRVRFTHALIRSALYEDILPPRRRLRHRQVGDMLLSSGGADPESVAYHFERAGDPRAVEWLIEAADRAFDSWALSSAIERYEAALRLIGPHGVSLSQRGSVLLRLAESYRYTNPGRSLEHLDEVEAIAVETGDAALTALTLWGRGRLRGPLGENGLAELRAAHQLLMELPPGDFDRVWGSERWNLGRITGTITQWYAVYGRYDDTLDIGNAYLANPRATDRDSLDGRHETLTATAIAYTALGRPDDARHAFLEAFNFYQSHAIWQMAQIVAFGCFAWLELVYYPDRLAERRDLAVALHEIWERPSTINDRVDPRAIQTPLMLIEGDWDELRHYARQLLGPALRVEALGWLGLLARYQGEWDEAWEYVQQALPDGPGADPERAGRSSFIGSLALACMAADLALDQGDLELARRWIETHDRWLAWCGAVIGRAENQLLWARYYQGAGELEQARGHAQRSLEHAANPRQPLAMLAAHRALGQLDIRARRYSHASAHLDTALSLADACAAPHERALTLLSRADLQVATHKTADARNALDEARTICAALGARPALESIASLEQRLSGPGSARQHVAGLSQRELEVLLLVTEGLTDAQVAERLYISPRTVGQHLRSVYNKLGVNSRSAAVAFAFAHDLL